MIPQTAVSGGRYCSAERDGFRSIWNSPNTVDTQCIAKMPHSQVSESSRPAIKVNVGNVIAREFRSWRRAGCVASSMTTRHSPRSMTHDASNESANRLTGHQTATIKFNFKSSVCQMSRTARVTGNARKSLEQPNRSARVLRFTRWLSVSAHDLSNRNSHITFRHCRRHPKP